MRNSILKTCKGLGLVRLEVVCKNPKRVETNSINQGSDEGVADQEREDAQVVAVEDSLENSLAEYAASVDSAPRSSWDGFQDEDCNHPKISERLQFLEEGGDSYSRLQQSIESYKNETSRQLHSIKRAGVIRGFASFVLIGVMCGVAFLGWTRTTDITVSESSLSAAPVATITKAPETIDLSVSTTKEPSAEPATEAVVTNTTVQVIGTEEQSRELKGPLPPNMALISNTAEIKKGVESKVPGGSQIADSGKLNGQFTQKPTQPVIAPPSQDESLKKPVAMAKAEEKIFTVDDKEAVNTPKQVVARQPMAVPLLADAPVKDATDDVSSQLKRKNPDTSRIETTSKASAPSGSVVERMEKYGSSGVITLMPSGIVVFDKASKVHKTVPVGGSLPDGSVLKSVDIKSSRISTNKGDVVFE